MVPYIITMFGADLLLFVDARLQTKSNIFFLFQGQITPDVTVGFDP